jgi:hypothetical protein
LRQYLGKHRYLVHRFPSTLQAFAATAMPDFLLVSVALARSMRLSLMKAAHAAVSSAARQEIRVPGSEFAFMDAIVET